MSYYVTSFISILHFISDDLIQCDATTRIVELFGDEFDDLDFELALCCFEATHKVAFADRLWETDAEDYEEMTIEEFLEAFVDAARAARPALRHQALPHVPGIADQSPDRGSRRRAAGGVLTSPQTRRARHGSRYS